MCVSIVMLEKGVMRGRRKRAITLLAALGVSSGCAPIALPFGLHPSEPPSIDWHARSSLTPKSTLPSRTEAAPSPVVQTQSQEPAISPVPTGVDEFVRLAVERNPRLAKAQFAINAAQGRYAQAGLYPNPDLAISDDELGDRTGPGGILSLPRLTQMIVTGRKLSLSQAIVAAEVDQATLALMTERYAVIAAVRAAFYDVYTLERRIAALDVLAKLAEDAVANGKVLLENKQIARLDLVQLEVEREKFRADAEAARRELPGARRALAAIVGDPRLAVGPLNGPFEVVPGYDLDEVQQLVLATHPEAQTARVGVQRAQAAIRRAQVEAIPNVTVFTGYVRQFENKSHDLSLGMNAPIPVWNRNQGNIRAAQAELGAAVQEVGRVENDLADRVATATRALAAAKQRAEAYRTEILPRAEETYDLSLKAFKGGQFEYLRVIQAQRSVAEARLVYNTALGQAWKAAAELSGLLLEESWPGPRPGPGAGPAMLPPPRKLPEIAPPPR